jgi:histidinol-phosphate aminotransferase
MRSFSKAYGLAGARIGYMISSKDNIKTFNTVKGGYETNILSASAAEFIIKNNHIVKDYVKKC